MSTEKWRSNMYLLLICIISSASGSFVGINIGTDLSNLPSAADMVGILQAQQIHHVRLFDADHHMLKALANTGIEVMVGIPNDELLRVGKSRSAAANWINRNVAPFLPATNITTIAVGSEVLTTIPHAAFVLASTLQFLQSALVATNLNDQVKVSTPQSMDIIPRPFPPSTATFNSTWNSVMYQILQFLKDTDSFFMLNAHPYFGYTEGGGVFPIEYALFKPLPPNKQIVDPNTLFLYTSMFDAMVDAAYYSMESLNFSRIPILVTESGWPSLGGSNESDATVDNALVYNRNLIQHVLNGSGTPSRPATGISTYIYELFNEDLRTGPLSEKNWGLYFPNGTAVYTLSSNNMGLLTGNMLQDGLLFCVAKPDANLAALKSGLDWACGLGQANCGAIQEGEPCFYPNTIEHHASYAYNDYFHRMRAAGGTCDFGQTAMTTANDPSQGSCIFAGSKREDIAPVSPGPASLSYGVPVLQVSKITFIIPTIFLALV